MKRIFGQMVLAIGLIFIFSLNTFAQQRETLTKEYNSSSVSSVKALVHISGGKLIMKEGTSKESKVEFDYLPAFWVPSFKYIEESKTGKLMVKSNYKIKDHEYDSKNLNTCTVELNKNVRYQLGIELSVGAAELDLSGFNIEKALFRLGIGDFDINLSNTSVPLFKMEAGIGQAEIDLTGEWKNNLEAYIKAGIGEITFIVPENVGVAFSIKGFLGDVDAHQMHKKGNLWVNDAYGKTDHTLEIYITGAIGNVVIKQR